MFIDKKRVLESSRSSELNEMLGISLNSEGNKPDVRVAINVSPLRGCFFQPTLALYDYF